MLILHIKKEEVNLSWDWKGWLHRRDEIWMKGHIWKEGR